MGKEALVFATYLLGESPPASVVERYEHLLGTSGLAKTDKVTSLASRFPFTLYFLDPACGLFRPAALLRKKLNVMSAVLECEPQLADRFLDPSDTHFVLLVLRSLWSGLRAIPGGLLLIFL